MFFFEKQDHVPFFNVKEVYLCRNISTKIFHWAFGADIYKNSGVPLKFSSRKFSFLKEQFM